MPVRPSPFRPAVAALALAALLSGCAGTDSAASPGNRASAASVDAAASPTATSTATAAPAAPAEQRIEVTVTGGQVTGDTGRVPVPAGEEVTLVITSDTADEVHVHGYDLTADLEPGRPAELSFAASIPGVFEVELHEAGTVLLSLQVG